MVQLTLPEEIIRKHEDFILERLFRNDNALGRGLKQPALGSLAVLFKDRATGIKNHRLCLTFISQAHKQGRNYKEEYVHEQTDAIIAAVNEMN